MKKHYLLTALALTAGALPASAAFVAASFAGDSLWEQNAWDQFTNVNPDVATYPSFPSGYAYTPDVASEIFGTGAPAVLQAGAPTLTGTGTGMFLATSTGNLYNPMGTNSYSLLDNPGLAGGANTLKGVSLQTRTSGNEIDYSSVKLLANTAGGVVDMGTAARTEISRTAAGQGGDTVESQFTWDLYPDVMVESYEIVWDDSTSSVSLMAVQLDTQVAPLALQAVPEPARAGLALLGAGILGLRRRRA